MDAHELNVFNNFKQEIIISTDPTTLANECFRQNYIDRNIHERLINADSLGVQRKRIGELLLKHLPCSCTLRNFLRMLYKLGYVHLSTSISDELSRQGAIHTNKIVTICRTNASTNQNAQIFFSMLKCHIHDNNIRNPTTFLRQLARHFQTKLQSEPNLGQRQLLADKSVAVISAELDMHTVSFHNREKFRYLYDELKSLVPQVTNTNVIDVVKLGRLAHAEALDGNISRGREIILAAHSSASNFVPCLELTNLFFLDVLIHLKAYEVHPTEAVRALILQKARRSLNFLEESAEVIRPVWTRMIVLRMIFCLLGIGSRGNVFSWFFPSHDDIAEAEYLLRKLDQNWNGIERRREMCYYLAKARLYEAKGDNAMALHYAHKALDLAEILQDNFNEITFIQPYVSHLENDSHRIRNLESESQTSLEEHVCESSFQVYTYDPTDDPASGLLQHQLRREQTCVSISNTNSSDVSQETFMGIQETSSQETSQETFMGIQETSSRETDFDRNNDTSDSIKSDKLFGE